MDPEIIVLCIVLVAKGISDITFGRKALAEVSKLRTAVEGRFEDHEKRLKKLED